MTNNSQRYNNFRLENTKLLCSHYPKDKICHMFILIIQANILHCFVCNQNLAHNHRFTLLFFVHLILSPITRQSPPIEPSWVPPMPKSVCNALSTLVPISDRTIFTPSLVYFHSNYSCIIQYNHEEKTYARVLFLLHLSPGFM